MNKTSLAVVLALACVGPGSAAPPSQRTLAGVSEPEMITVDANELYVVEGANILVFSLDTLKLVKTLGGQGEGPGEFRAADFWYNTVTVLPESVFVDGYDKAVYFSKDGRLLRESKKPLGTSKMVPVGDNFVGVKLDHLEGDVQYQCLRLYDSRGTFLRELARQESPLQAATRKTEMIPDVLNFSVWAGRIFVEKSREGLVLDAFDSAGVRRLRIEQKSAKIRVTKDDQNEALENLKNDPFVKRFGFERFKSFSQFVWPETLPAIRDFIVADERIYIRTSGTRDGREDWLILDLQGEPLGHAFLPPPEAPPFMANLYGVRYYTIHDQKLYFLKDNVETEAWELFVEAINWQE